MYSRVNGHISHPHKIVFSAAFTKTSEALEETEHWTLGYVMLKLPRRAKFTLALCFFYMVPFIEGASQVPQLKAFVGILERKVMESQTHSGKNA